MSFQIDQPESKNCKIIRLKGRFVEAAESDEILLALDNDLLAGNKHYVVDLAETTLVNSSGINMLVKMVKKVNHESGNIVFAAVPDRVQELLNVIRLNSVFTIYPTVEDGVHSIN
jgi:anti-sigma B factor antagonist